MRRFIYFWEKVNASPFNRKRGLSLSIVGEITEKIGNFMHTDAEVDGNKIFMRRCIYFWTKVNASPFNLKSGISISIDGEVTEINWKSHAD